MREGKQGRASRRIPDNSLEFKKPIYGRKRYYYG